jgi:GT2 family glycosyltransferase
VSQRPRVLLVITVYNGRAFVPACIRSAMDLDRSTVDADVLILDDASPEPGWSDELRALCAELGAQYYLSPRNLGIPRNVNLGLLRAVDASYDYVIISNSDVIYPRSMLETMIETHRSDPKIGSVTAWSNNVSVYSLPNSDPDLNLSSQPIVDWVSASLAGEFGDAAIDVPAGISFCIQIPTEVVRTVGIMDPVFGRGYCEETDWSLRSRARGYRITLSPSTFVYHHGRGSTEAAGLVTGGHTTVPENEAIIDLRYPFFRSQVDAFLSSDILDKAWTSASRRIIRDAATAWGYRLDVGWLHRPNKHDDQFVRVTVEPDGGTPLVTMEFKGFVHQLETTSEAAERSIIDLLGRDPLSANVRDAGALARALRSQLEGRGVVVARGANYPTRV